MESDKPKMNLYLKYFLSLEHMQKFIAYVFHYDINSVFIADIKDDVIKMHEVNINKHLNKQQEYVLCQYRFFKTGDAAILLDIWGFTIDTKQLAKMFLDAAMKLGIVCYIPFNQYLDSEICYFVNLKNISTVISEDIYDEENLNLIGIKFSPHHN